MAKTAVTQWDTTADNNTDVGGIGIQGTNKPSNFDNAMREVMAQIATFITAGVFTSTTYPVRLYSADAGAAIGPVLDIYRDSSSPAASDVLGGIEFNGESSTGVKRAYGTVKGVIETATNGSEDGAVVVDAMRAGSSVRVAFFSEDYAGLGADGSEDFFVGRNDDDGYLEFQGGNAANGGTMRTYGGTHSTKAGDIEFYSGGTLRYNYDLSATLHQFNGTLYAEDDVRFSQNSTNTPGSGNNTQGLGFAAANGALCINTSGSHVIGKTADGTVAVINSEGTAEGTISISGTTCTFGTFMGSHWSQLADGSKSDILRGTICESIDQMCAWDGSADDHLPRFKISDTPGSTAVYGVFAWWDDFEADKTNDAFIGSLGAFVVRMAPGQTVQRGDYVESNGDGCGRVQADDILRASTVAKVTSSTIVETYPDGSFLVPCTLHCG